MKFRLAVFTFTFHGAFNVSFSPALSSSSAAASAFVVGGREVRRKQKQNYSTQHLKVMRKNTRAK